MPSSPKTKLQVTRKPVRVVLERWLCPRCHEAQDSEEGAAACCVCRKEGCDGMRFSTGVCRRHYQEELIADARRRRGALDKEIAEMERELAAHALAARKRALRGK
jgi:hypothetical protein